MKKIFAKIFLFLVLLFLLDNVVYTLFSSLYRRSYLDHYHLIEKSNPEIIFLGTSRFMSGIDPRVIKKITGLSAYNASWDNSGVIYSKGMMSLVLRKYHPKLFVIEALDDLYGKSDITGLAPYFEIPEVADVLNYLPFKARLRYSFFKTTRYNSKILSILKRSFVKYDMNYGYVPLYGNTGPVAASLLNPPKKEVDSQVSICLNEMVKQGEASRVPILFVQMPFLQTIRPEEDFFLKISNEKNISFLNIPVEGFERGERLTGNEFHDSTHVNAAGAKIISNYIAIKITRLLREP